MAGGADWLQGCHGGDEYRGIPLRRDSRSPARAGVPGVITTPVYGAEAAIGASAARLRPIGVATMLATSQAERPPRRAHARWSRPVARIHPLLFVAPSVLMLVLLLALPITQAFLRT